MLDSQIFASEEPSFLCLCCTGQAGGAYSGLVGTPRHTHTVERIAAYFCSHDGEGRFL